MSRKSPLLIHLHIPKNAGTTLSRMIKGKIAVWPPSHVFRHGRTLGYYYLKHEHRLEKLMSLPDHHGHQVRFVEAHAGFGLHEDLPSPSTYITFLREPIDRTISVYAFQRQHERISRDLSLLDWIQDDDPQRVWYVDNAQVRYLAGDQGNIIDVPFGGVTREMLDIAKERLDKHFLLVGLVEQFDASVLLLRRAMGWRHCYYAKSNITKKRSRVDDLDSATIDALKEMNALDLELYEHARLRLQEQIDAAGPEFKVELVDFSERMKKHGPILARMFNILGSGRKLRRWVLNRLARLKHGSDTFNKG